MITVTKTLSESLDENEPEYDRPDSIFDQFPYPESPEIEPAQIPKQHTVPNKVLADLLEDVLQELRELKVFVKVALIEKQK